MAAPRALSRAVGAPLLAALWGLLCALGPAGPAAAQPFEPAPEDADARAIARRAEDALRSDGTYLEAVMTVVSPRLSSDREIAFRSWDDRPGRRSLIRILSPAKDAGTGFLKLHPNLWMYVPRVERTLRIPPSMMLQSWMGSDFTNDDLVRESSSVDDYAHRLLGIDPEPPGPETGDAWVVEYRPREDAPVVWGRIVAWIDREHGTPLRQDFYSESDALVRRLAFSDFREVQGRHVPHRWTMTPLDKEGHQTRIVLREIRFDQTFDEAIFTTRQLKNPE